MQHWLFIEFWLIFAKELYKIEVWYIHYIFIKMHISRIDNSVFIDINIFDIYMGVILFTIFAVIPVLTMVSIFI